MRLTSPAIAAITIARAELKIKLFAAHEVRIETQAGDLLRLENRGTQAHDSPLN